MSGVGFERHSSGANDEQMDPLLLQPLNSGTVAGRVLFFCYASYLYFKFGLLIM